MIDELINLINHSNNIVVFTGAGVSTSSGIKDFRSKDGLYNMKYKYPVELILSHTFFINDTEEFYRFYKDKFNCVYKRPNICHKYLKKLEDLGKLKGIITQNIDGLHTKAGNKNVIEFHGTIYKNHCTKCNKFYDAKYVFESKKIPLCECGGIIKPDVVLYEEPPNTSDIDESIKYIQKSDVLIVIGSSLSVYPVSGLINYYRGNKLVIINRDKTTYDFLANLVINDELDHVFNELNS